MQFSKAQAQLALEVGAVLTAEKPDAKIRASLNFAKVEVGKYAPWKHLEVTNWEFVVVPDYETGTASITKDSRTVTISGGTLTSDFKGRFFSSSKSTSPYEIRNVSGNDLILKTPMAEDSASGLKYTVSKVYYRWPSDIRLILPRIELWNKPTIAEVNGYDEYAADYDTGNIALTKGSKTATFAGAVLLDKVFPGDIIEAQSRDYRIRTVVSDTEITMVNRAAEKCDGKFKIKSDTPYKGKLIGIGKQDDKFLARFNYIRSLYYMVAEDDDTELPIEFDRDIIDWAKAEYKRLDDKLLWENDLNLAQKRLIKLSLDSTLAIQSADLFAPAIPVGLGRGDVTGRRHLRG